MISLPTIVLDWNQQDDYYVFSFFSACCFRRSNIWLHQLTAF